MIIFFCLRFETPPTWRVRPPYLYRPGTGWSGYTPRHWVPFGRLLRLAGLRWSYLTPPLAIEPRQGTRSIHCSPTVLLLLCVYPLQRTRVNQPLPRTGQFLLARLFRLSGVISQYCNVDGQSGVFIVPCRAVPNRAGPGRATLIATQRCGKHLSVALPR
jgi:hypothetical protein